MVAPMTRLLRPSVLSRARPIAITKPMVAVRGYAGKDIGPGKTHTTDKPATDVQADASQKGQAERNSSSTNSSATSGKDVNNSNEKAKQEHPEAPDTVIGMNDERGGKGH